MQPRGGLGAGALGQIGAHLGGYAARLAHQPGQQAPEKGAIAPGQPRHMGGIDAGNGGQGRGFGRCGVGGGARLGGAGRGRRRAPWPALQQGHQLLQVQRFGQHGVHPGIARLLLFLLEHTGRHGNHRQLRQAQLTADGARGAQAVEHGHLHVHQHRIERFGAAVQALQRRPAIARAGGARAFDLQHALQHIEVQRVVIHDQVVAAHQARPRGGGLGGARVGAALGQLGCAGQRQLEPEGAAFALAAFHANVAAHQLHQALANDQAQPGATKAAADAGIGLREGGKQLGQRLRGHANARVADLKAQPGAVRIGVQQVYAQSDLALGGEFDGVTDQIGQHLL